ncbi:MAG: adenylosuccinate synthetase [Bacteroidota bacterium]
MTTAYLIVDLGFGDAGKGSLTDFLARRAVTDGHGVHTVVRYNGGPQAGHNVVTPDGRHHTFSQFGAGTFVPGVRTHLARHMLVSPAAMLAEAAHLDKVGVPDSFSRTTISAQSLIITPFQQAANRLRELARGDARHGSCGMGVGEAQADRIALGDEAVLFAGDLADEARTRAKLQALRAYKRAQLDDVLARLPDTPAVRRERVAFDADDVVETTLDGYRRFLRHARIVGDGYLGEVLRWPGGVVFEGAQGVLLDEWYGFHPHTTWATTTLAHADALLAEQGYGGAVTKLGLTRAYQTRHGAGPMPTEDPTLSRERPDAHNGDDPWQHGFRVGPLDLPLLRYAHAVVGHLDGLVVSCLDRIANRDGAVATGYWTDAPFPAASFVLADDVRANDNPLIRTIEVHPSQWSERQRLDHQERIGRALGTCRPVYEHDLSPAALAYRVADDLGVPLALTSWGPTAADKRIVASELLPATP